ncbi:hypothetical protein [Nocardia sp. NPDC050710]|uniref:cyanobactin maturation protease PatG family protein n=1 Tax=Nocardia sp. NPDC050710 TaxID=3157220 RepID=UPI0033D15EED
MSHNPAESVGWSVTAVASKQLVYGLGTLGYEFSSDDHRKSFIAKITYMMKSAAEEVVSWLSDLGGKKPAEPTGLESDPDDPRQMVEYLRKNPSEAKGLIWTLIVDQAPIYAISPAGTDEGEIYARLIELLDGQARGDAAMDGADSGPDGMKAGDSEACIWLIGVAGRLGGRTIELRSGQIVPVLEVERADRLNGLDIRELVDMTTAGAAETKADRTQDRTSLTDNEIDERERSRLRGFLNRIHFDSRNLGVTSRDRALNFAVFQGFSINNADLWARSDFATIFADDISMESIDIEKSAFERGDGDTREVEFRFYDPTYTRNVEKVFRYTVDVSGVQPITVRMRHSDEM